MIEKSVISDNVLLSVCLFYNLLCFKQHIFCRQCPHCLDLNFLKDQELLLTMVSYVKNTWKLKYKRKKNPVGGFGNNPIYPLLSTWISTWTEPEALYE